MIVSVFHFDNQVPRPLFRKEHVGHEICAQGLRNPRAVKLAQGVARSASDDELVPPAMQGSQVHLENVHRGVVDIEKICEVQNHDLGGVRSRDALGIGDAFQFTYRTEKEGAVTFQASTLAGMSKGSVVCTTRVSVFMR